ncbi:hypothetical protein [Sedimenticola thiotaurini]|uniref:Uncharacterized protein n=1 Tax=Sedimenticola thiotaurini TaxID=1543721 RepID=A0A0F7K3G5_9GAMM|nr:hypothetical protein [Sedimenticola thiotaurini]AKH21483.1 hypothetical protein AAY24_15240 [Sedimenticola thiotaurini]
MSHKPSPLITRKAAQTVEQRLHNLFTGYDGFGIIIYFWTLIGSFIAAVTLIVAGLAFWNWWILFLGLLALRSYAYLGNIGQDLLDKISPHDS